MQLPLTWDFVWVANLGSWEKHVKQLVILEREPEICTIDDGDVSERPKELASKASVGQPTEGSNPSVTAM